MGGNSMLGGLNAGDFGGGGGDKHEKKARRGKRGQKFDATFSSSDDNDMKMSDNDNEDLALEGIQNMPTIKNMKMQKPTNTATPPNTIPPNTSITNTTTAINLSSINTSAPPQNQILGLNIQEVHEAVKTATQTDTGDSTGVFVDELELTEARSKLKYSRQAGIRGRLEKVMSFLKAQRKVITEGEVTETTRQVIGGRRALTDDERENIITEIATFTKTTAATQDEKEGMITLLALMNIVQDILDELSF